MFTQEQAMLFLTPSKALSKWWRGSPSEESEDAESDHLAKPIVSMAYGVSIISQIRAILWTDSMVQKGYEI
ncbi:hypothetical protein FRC17_006044, partial [Serendipita sp. 399]